MKSIQCIIMLLFFLVSPALAQDEYSFDLSETETTPYSIGGYIEFMPRVFWPDHDSAFYRLNFYNCPERDILDEYNGKLSVNGKYRKGITDIHMRANINHTESDIESGTDITVDEGYCSVKSSSSLSINLGKKTLKWGKGYAWNPVAFIDRPKNPDDPDLAREGYIVMTADYIKTFQGPLQTISVTPVIIPVYDHINSDYGMKDHTNYAGKIYFLLYDTDIDIMFLKGNSRPSRAGIDFSRNITSNFEVHGEFAYIDDATKKTIDSAGKPSRNTCDAKSYLFGLRYLTQWDTTFIGEYYRNGTGFTKEETEEFFKLVDNGYNKYISSADDSLLVRARSLTEGNYGRTNPMKDYIYVRITQKDPFDMLYVTPSITWIYNIDDKSFSLSPEILYSGITNLEVRLKGGMITGRKSTEFGEKQNDCRIELRLRYYFDATGILNFRTTENSTPTL
jgi:hypothetical protein